MWDFTKITHKSYINVAYTGDNNASIKKDGILRKAEDTNVDPLCHHASAYTQHSTDSTQKTFGVIEYLKIDSSQGKHCYSICCK